MRAHAWSTRVIDQLVALPRWERHERSLKQIEKNRNRDDTRSERAPGTITVMFNSF